MHALSSGAAGHGSGSSPRPEREHWHSLGLQQRWTLIVLTIQALAAAGTFIAALIGLWSVSPIISYRIEQQQEQARQEQASAAGAAETVVMLPDTHPVTAAFVEDVGAWWTARVGEYARVTELVGGREALGLDLAFEIAERVQIVGMPESSSDTLVLTARWPDGHDETVTAVVNERAMSLIQYIQYRINHAAFGALETEARERVEAAVARYMQFYMTPRASPPHVSAAMTLDEIATEVAACQPLRVESFKHIRALNAVIEVALIG